MSYFAEPNFIIYDEWFDDNLEKKKINFRNKKIKPISNIHEYFYIQSNNQIGASENNMELNIKKIKKELTINNSTDNISVNYSPLLDRKSRFFDKFKKSKFRLGPIQKLICSLSLFFSIMIFGYIKYSISHSPKNESSISINFYNTKQDL